MQIFKALTSAVLRGGERLPVHPGPIRAPQIARLHSVLLATCHQTMKRLQTQHSVTSDPPQLDDIRLALPQSEPLPITSRFQLKLYILAWVYCAVEYYTIVAESSFARDVSTPQQARSAKLYDLPSPGSPNAELLMPPTTSTQLCSCCSSAFTLLNRRSRCMACHALVCGNCIHSRVLHYPAPDLLRSPALLSHKSHPFLTAQQNLQIDSIMSESNTPKPGDNSNVDMNSHMSNPTYHQLVSSRILQHWIRQQLLYNLGVPQHKTNEVLFQCFHHIISLPTTKQQQQRPHSSHRPGPDTGAHPEVLHGADQSTSRQSSLPQPSTTDSMSRIETASDVTEISRMRAMSSSSSQQQQQDVTPPVKKSSFFSRLRSTVTQTLTGNDSSTSSRREAPANASQHHRPSRESSQRTTSAQANRTNLQHSSASLEPVKSKLCMQCCVEYDAMDRGIAIDDCFAFLDAYVARHQKAFSQQQSAMERYVLHSMFSYHPFPGVIPVSDSVHPIHRIQSKGFCSCPECLGFIDPFGVLSSLRQVEMTAIQSPHTLFLPHRDWVVRSCSHQDDLGGELPSFYENRIAPFLKEFRSFPAILQTHAMRNITLSHLLAFSLFVASQLPQSPQGGVQDPETVDQHHATHVDVETTFVTTSERLQHLFQQILEEIDSYEQFTILSNFLEKFLHDILVVVANVSPNTNMNSSSHQELQLGESENEHLMRRLNPCSLPLLVLPFFDPATSPKQPSQRMDFHVDYAQDHATMTTESRHQTHHQTACEKTIPLIVSPELVALVKCMIQSIKEAITAHLARQGMVFAIMTQEDMDILRAKDAVEVLTAALPVGLTLPESICNRSISQMNAIIQQLNLQDSSLSTSGIHMIPLPSFLPHPHLVFPLQRLCVVTPTMYHRLTMPYLFLTGYVRPTTLFNVSNPIAHTPFQLVQLSSPQVVSPIPVVDRSYSRRLAFIRPLFEVIESSPTRVSTSSHIEDILDMPLFSNVNGGRNAQNKQNTIGNGNSDPQTSSAPLSIAHSHIVQHPQTYYREKPPAEQLPKESDLGDIFKTKRVDAHNAPVASPPPVSQNTSPQDEPLESPDSGNQLLPTKARADSDLVLDFDSSSDRNDAVLPTTSQTKTNVHQLDDDEDDLLVVDSDNIQDHEIEGPDTSPSQHMIDNGTGNNNPATHPDGSDDPPLQIADPISSQGQRQHPLPQVQQQNSTRQRAVQRTRHAYSETPHHVTSNIINSELLALYGEVWPVNLAPYFVHLLARLPQDSALQQLVIQLQPNLIESILNLPQSESAQQQTQQSIGDQVQKQRNNPRNTYLSQLHHYHLLLLDKPDYYFNTFYRNISLSRTALTISVLSRTTNHGETPSAESSAQPTPTLSQNAVTSISPFSPMHPSSLLLSTALGMTSPNTYGSTDHQHGYNTITRMGGGSGVTTPGSSSISSLSTMSHSNAFLKYNWASHVKNQHIVDLLNQLAVVHANPDYLQIQGIVGPPNAVKSSTKSSSPLPYSFQHMLTSGKIPVFNLSKTPIRVSSTALATISIQGKDEPPAATMPHELAFLSYTGTNFLHHVSNLSPFSPSRLTNQTNLAYGTSSCFSTWEEHQWYSQFYKIITSNSQHHASTAPTTAESRDSMTYPPTFLLQGGQVITFNYRHYISPSTINNLICHHTDSPHTTSLTNIIPQSLSHVRQELSPFVYVPLGSSREIDTRCSGDQDNGSNITSSSVTKSGHQPLAHLTSPDLHAIDSHIILTTDASLTFDMSYIKRSSVLFAIPMDNDSFNPFQSSSGLHISQLDQNSAHSNNSLLHPLAIDSVSSPTAVQQLVSPSIFGFPASAYRQYSFQFAGLAPSPTSTSPGGAGSQASAGEYTSSQWLLVSASGERVARSTMSSASASISGMMKSFFTTSSSNTVGMGSPAGTPSGSMYGSKSSITRTSKDHQPRVYASHFSSFPLYKGVLPRIINSSLIKTTTTTQETPLDTKTPETQDEADRHSTQQQNQSTAPEAAHHTSPSSDIPTEETPGSIPTTTCETALTTTTSPEQGRGVTTSPSLHSSVDLYRTYSSALAATHLFTPVFRQRADPQSHNSLGGNERDAFYTHELRSHLTTQFSLIFIGSTTPVRHDLYFYLFSAGPIESNRPRSQSKTISQHTKAQQDQEYSDDNDDDLVIAIDDIIPLSQMTSPPTSDNPTVTTETDSHANNELGSKQQHDVFMETPSTSLVLEYPSPATMDLLEPKHLGSLDTDLVGPASSALSVLEWLCRVQIPAEVTLHVHVTHNTRIDPSSEQCASLAISSLRDRYPVNSFIDRDMIHKLFGKQRMQIMGQFQTILRKHPLLYSVMSLPAQSQTYNSSSVTSHTHEKKRKGRLADVLSLTHPADSMQHDRPTVRGQFQDVAYLIASQMNADFPGIHNNIVSKAAKALDANPHSTSTLPQQDEHNAPSALNTLQNVVTVIIDTDNIYRLPNTIIDSQQSAAAQTTHLCTATVPAYLSYHPLLSFPRPDELHTVLDYHSRHFQDRIRRTVRLLYMIHQASQTPVILPSRSAAVHDPISSSSIARDNVDPTMTPGGQPTTSDTASIHSFLLHQVYFYGMNLDKAVDDLQKRLAKRAMQSFNHDTPVLQNNVTTDHTMDQDHHALSLIALPNIPSDPNWKLLGFQAETPGTDFRSHGIFSIHILLYMAQHHQSFFRTLLMLHESQSQIYGYNWCFAETSQALSQDSNDDHSHLDYSPFGIQILDHCPLTSPAGAHVPPASPPPAGAASASPLDGGDHSEPHHQAASDIIPDTLSESHRREVSISSHQRSQSKTKVSQAHRNYPLSAVIVNIAALILSFLPPAHTFAHIPLFYDQSLTQCASELQQNRSSNAPIPHSIPPVDSPAYYTLLQSSTDWFHIYSDDTTSSPSQKNPRAHLPQQTHPTSPTQDTLSEILSSGILQSSPIATYLDLASKSDIKQTGKSLLDTFFAKYVHYADTMVMQSSLLRILMLPHPLSPAQLLFELTVQLIALCDVLTVRHRTQYLDFPFILTTLQNRLSSALNRDPVSFDVFIRMMWCDELPLFLTLDQLSLCNNQSQHTADDDTVSPIIQSFASHQQDKPPSRCHKCVGHQNHSLCRGIPCIVEDIEYLYHPILMTASVVARRPTFPTL